MQANVQYSILKKQKASASTAQSGTRLDQHLKGFNQIYHTQNKRVILLISAFMLMLGILGLLWALPFPHLNWLGKYNGYINWASFFIAIAGYYYYRLSPVIGYLVILLLFAFAYLVTCMQGWEAVGGPSLKLVSSILMAVALLMALLINKRLLDRVTLSSAVTYWLISPLWMMSSLFKKISRKQS